MLKHTATFLALYQFEHQTKIPRTQKSTNRLDKVTLILKKKIANNILIANFCDGFISCRVIPKMSGFHSKCFVFTSNGRSQNADHYEITRKKAVNYRGTAK